MRQYPTNTSQRTTEADWFAPQVFASAGEYPGHMREAQPSFLLVDCFDPHEPWDPPKKYVDLYGNPDYAGREPTVPNYSDASWMTEGELERMRALYAGEVTMTDAWLGHFLERIEDFGLVDRHSGVDLVDAVAASTSNGLAYGIGEDRYINGGYRRSSENADLAAGYARVLVLAAFGGRSRYPLEWGMHLAAQVDELRARGSRVEAIFPDSDSEHMFGANAMDLSLRPPAARAGYDQGRALAERLTEFWR